MAKKCYSSEKPAEPGWYWCWQPADNSEFVCIVGRMKDGDPLYATWLIEPARAGILFESEWDASVQWYGPLDLPSSEPPLRLKSAPVFEPSKERITKEWLWSVCDRMEFGNRPEFAWAIFEVEIDQEDGAYTLLRVEAEDDQTCAIEIVTNCGEDAKDEAVGIGLYQYRDDVLALIEILARGCHGWPIIGRAPK